ncbi:hypothetical protein L0Y65_03825 [Candidatus Micrarchaeota archaeon]|nr:hypothetical protein [Candidatus Micrarchaeota archaeon]
MILHGTQVKTGSVGASWPPRYDEHNRRVKGFCTRTIGSMDDARAMLAEVREVQSASPAATRTTIRAFVERGLVEPLRRESPLQVEACFDADNAVGGHAIVYFGSVADQRVPPGDVTAREIASVVEIQRLERTGWLEASIRITSAGYSISRLNGDGQAQVGRLLELYREAYQEYTFDLTQQTVSGMLSNGNIVIVGQDRMGEVVSALIAEHVELSLEFGKVVHLFELSDYATFRAHRGMGLITLMQMEAINTIRAMPGGDGAVIYAEDRAAWMAVNRSSQKAGMTYCGTLPQHCVIVSDRDFGEEGRYENLNVWAHIPGQDFGGR